MGTPVFLIIVAGILLYFLPTILGHKKQHATGIILLNIFLGWTLLGWLGALIWAVSSPETIYGWKYVCNKCGYVKILDQEVTLFVCPQCRHETAIESTVK
jgi:predicted RNA-binding Zn-ribbon protein involved in translation (DUF1610 family)